jgi:hypothetical protein
MRWFFRILPLAAILAAVYLGTAVVSLQALVEDVRSGDTSAIMARIDIPRLRDSLVDQILRAHFSHIEQTRPVKRIERIAAPTVVDALMAKLLTPENITRVLQSGTLPVGASNLPPFALPTLNSAGLETTGRILARLRPRSPVTLQVLLDDTGQSAIRLHYEVTHWKLSGLDLPPAALERLVAEIRAR